MYRIYRGRTTGYVDSYEELKQSVKNYTGAHYELVDDKVVHPAVPCEGEAEAGAGENVSRTEAERGEEVKLKVLTPAIVGVRGYCLKYNEHVDSELFQRFKDIHGYSRGDEVHVFTDGSTYRNGMDDCTGGIGVFIIQPEGYGGYSCVSALVEGEKITNNVCELLALYITASLCIDIHTPVTVYTDSQYAITAINNFQSWLEEERKHIPNRELIRQLLKRFRQVKSYKVRHTRAHTGGDDFESMGNHIADRLAQYRG